MGNGVGTKMDWKAILLLGAQGAFTAIAAPTSVAGYEAAAVIHGGTVAGVVRVAKPLPPPLPPLDVFKSKSVCGETVPNEALVVASDGALRYAVVSFEDVRRGQAPEAETVTVIDNLGCRFLPRVVSASVGQWLLFRNSDPVLHNADGRMDGRTVFNIGLPKGREVRRPLVEPGLIEITCNVRHTWMKAWAFVAVHPYHAVTDAEGAYEIRDVPPGHYVVWVWHERLGEHRKEVDVEAGKVVSLDFVLPH
jgi:plastocyanin